MRNTQTSGNSSSAACQTQQWSSRNNRAGTKDDEVAGLKGRARAINLNHHQVVQTMDPTKMNQIAELLRQEIDDEKDLIDRGKRIK